jgi:hypothetical protein
VKQRVFVTIVALVIASLAGVASASAQGLSANVPFAFVAGGKDMPAGKYSVEIMPNGPITLVGPGSDRIMMSAITQLGRHDRDADPEFVFDKLNGKLLLSEIWAPGRDGLLVLATATPHEHAVIGGSNPRK